MKGYKLSTDYQKLWDLIHQGIRVPAWIDYQGVKIVEVKKHPESIYINIGTPGIGYETFEKTFEAFSENCTSLNLKYIEPNAK